MSNHLTNLDGYLNNEVDNGRIIAELAVKKKTHLNPDDNEGHLTVDVFQTKDEIIIQSAIAGADPDEIDISISKDVVTIKGTREPEHKIKSTDYFHQEIYWGRFSRAIILPADVNPDKAKAAFKNGILTISLPKL